MTMPKEEAEALRRCLSILAPLHPIHERQTMALQIERRIAGQESALLALSFKQLGPLFYPTDTHMAQEVAQKMQDAFNAGELASSLKSYANGVFISDLIAWPDCPPVPIDSPLAYWLPKVMQAPAIADSMPSNNVGAVKYTTKHRDLLAPRIADAQNRSADRFDTPSVWAELKRMAESKLAPFIGVSDEGLKWEDGVLKVQFFTLKNLRDRLRTQKGKAAKS